MTAGWEDFIEEPDTLKELVSPRNRLIMVIGGSDTGKTTLVERIAHFLSGHTSTGVVDLDMGQSHIGPPTAIAWGKINKGFQGWEKTGMADYYFTGTTTPVGSLLPVVAGAKLMTDKALSVCQKVIADTTGLISEPAGRILKQLKIDLLCPDMVLALERSNELEHILDAFRFQKRAKIYRLSVPAAVKTKSAARRGRYRFEKIKKYLVHSHILEVSVEGVGLRFAREPLRFSSRELKNRIVSFRDEKNVDTGLGFIAGIALREKKLLIRTPVSSSAHIAAIVIGRAEIDMANSVLVDKR